MARLSPLPRSQSQRTTLLWVALPIGSATSGKSLLCLDVMRTPDKRNGRRPGAKAKEGVEERSAEATAVTTKLVGLSDTNGKAK